MPVTNLRTRGSPSDSLQDTVLDILVIASISILCALIVAGCVLHCMSRRRERDRLSQDWTSCRALNIMSSSSSSAAEFPKDGDYLVYEVELTRNYGSGKAPGKDEAVTSCCEKGPPIADMQQGVERVHLLVPLPAQNTYLPDKA